MAEETNDKKKLQWHAAFFAEIQIELAEDADKLVFENEHQLLTKPMSIDVLIIKKLKDELIKKIADMVWKKFPEGFIIFLEQCFPCSWR